MGGKFSRDKGKRGEREVIDLLQPVLDEVYDAHGREAPVLKRNTLQSDSGGDDIAGLHWLSLEVKRHEVLAVNKWWEQCTRQAAKSQVPVLLYRQNGKRDWNVVMFGRIGTHTARVTVDTASFLVWFRNEVHIRLQGETA